MKNKKCSHRDKNNENTLYILDRYSEDDIKIWCQCEICGRKLHLKLRDLPKELKNQIYDFEN